MSLPDPILGLVISYSCLWAREHGTGAEAGRKDRPCAIVAARQVIEGPEDITVVPVKHIPPSDPEDAVEMSPALKAQLGLGELPSWVVVTFEPSPQMARR